MAMTMRSHCQGSRSLDAYEEILQIPRRCRRRSIPSPRARLWPSGIPGEISWERVMNKTVWIVVAKRGVARLFQARQPTGPLEELDAFIHPEASLHEQDLVSDRPG